ncbi:MAG: DUF3298 and DUF4163 domain-containing protein [Candidatus Eremiobacteraeota bacterium]|nr:DUF3298 and DUF4163 domain-containing protein [Candidatus Eremiobacteraeota bacterium]
MNIMSTTRVTPFPTLMRSLQNLSASESGLSAADSVSLTGAEDRGQAKDDIVSIIKMKDVPPADAPAQAAQAQAAQDSQAAPAQDTPPAPKTQITKAPISKEEKDCTIAIEYPQVSGGLSEESQKAINKTLESFVKKQISDFEEAVKENGPREGFGSSIEGGFNTSANNDRFISFTEGCSSYLAGCAHPNHELITFNFDAKTGSSLTFHDLFSLPDDEIDRSFLFRDNMQARREREKLILRTVSDYCIKDLIKQNEDRPDDAKIDESLIREVAAPEEGKFDLFALTDKGIVMDFYYCHAAGYGEVTIPYEALAEIIDPESVLENYARKDEKKPIDDGTAPEIVVDDDMIIIDDIKLDIRKR